MAFRINWADTFDSGAFAGGSRLQSGDEFNQESGRVAGDSLSRTGFHAAAAPQTLAAPASTFGMSDETAFISGVYPNGTLPLYTFYAWNSDTPATYTGGYSNSQKWGQPTANTPGGTINYYFTPASNWSPTEQQFLSAGLALWSDVANISFVQTTSPSQAQIVFTRGHDGNAQTNPTTVDPGGGGVTGGSVLLTLTKATVSIDTSVSGFGPIDGTFTTGGGYPIMTFLHEEGHAIGLGHAGPYNGTVDPATQQFSPYDTRLWSIMSYIEPRTTSAEFFSQYPVTGTNWGIGPSGFHSDPTGLMPLDIAAAQALYGLPVSTPLSGGQVFGFGCNVAGPSAMFFDFTQNTVPILTLWDAGPNNTLNLTGFSANSTVNLNPGTFSSCDGLTNNIGIAFGTAIDTAICGPGNDTITANNDGDTLNGGAGNNTLLGGSGNDVLVTGIGNDTLNGGSGFNIASYANAAAGVTVDLSMTGPQNTGGGVDVLQSIQGVIGSPFDDVLKGDGTHNVLLLGGGGNDILQSGAGDDLLDGGSGFNIASYATASAGVTIDLSITGEQNTGGGGSDILANIQGVIGSSFGDVLKGDGVHNVLLEGGGGNDILQGGAGDDDLDGGSGFNIANYANAAAGVTIDLSITSEQNTGGAGSDILTNIQGIFGSPFGDVLKGDGTHNVLLAGGGGNDILQSGAGDDLLDGGSGFNIASYATATAGVSIDLSITGEQNTGGAGSDILANIQGIVGSSFNDVLKGNGVNNVLLAGGGGNDILQGGAGDDYLNGGTGNDTLTGGGGADIFVFTKGDGLDLITDFAPGTDQIDLNGYGVSDFASLQPFMSQQGSDVLIAFDPQDHITLHNVLLGSLHSGDFMFG